MIRAILTLLSAHILLFCALAQNDSLFNSKGIYLGKRGDLMLECVNGIKENKVIAELDPYAACSCMLLIALETPEVDNALSRSALDDLDLKSLLENDRALNDQFIECTAKSITGDTPLSDMGKEAMKEMTESCILEILANPELKKSGADARILCECMFEQVEQRNLTMAQLQLAQDPNSPLFNEVMVPCVTRSMGHQNTQINGGSTDVSGTTLTARIPIISMGNVQKVKVSLGNIVQYYVIDSGANDCIISTDLADRLRAAGMISSETLLDSAIYTMADGRKLECARFLAQGMVIGDLTVNNVVVGIMEHDVTNILGKSFLDKFFEWTIETSTSTLYLKRQ